jgi:transposase-like protein
MAGGIILPDGRRRADAIREDYAANMRRSDIARKYGVAFQIVYQATRDMGSHEGGGRLPSQSGGVAVTSARRTTPPRFVPSLTVKADGGFHEPEFVEEISPVEEDLFPPS